jgi:hypothetical protein
MDPVIFIIVLQGANKKLNSSNKYFCFFLFEGKKKNQKVITEGIKV